MESELFPVTVSYPPPPKQLNCFIVVAFWAPGGWWKVFTELYTTQEAAEKAAKELSRGYTERRIYHLR